MCHLSRFGSLCAQVPKLLQAPAFLRVSVYTGLGVGAAAALVAALVAAHALNNVVLNVPQPPACIGGYKQISVDISAHYKGWDLNESIDIASMPLTHSVIYTQEAGAAVVAASTGNTTADNRVDWPPIQVPLRLDLGQVLDSNLVIFYVNIRCSAGPITLSRRNHYYLRDGVRWNSLGWRPVALDPLSRGSADYNKWILGR
ncbi:hypothetical protein PG984_014163 [Apiospora sp. TS-2023a]